MDSTRFPRSHPRAMLARAALLAVVGGAAATSFAQYSAQPKPPTPGQAPAPAPAQAPAAAQGEAYRPEIATPLRAAEQLIQAKKFDEALLKVREAAALADRTPAENVAIERTRAIAAFGAGDLTTATRSFEIVIASGRGPDAERAKMTQVVAQLYFQQKDYPKAVIWAERSLKESGPNPDTRWLLISAQYLSNDCQSASRELRTLIEADEKSSTRPAQDRLQMLAACYTKLNDSAGYDHALGKLLTYYPSKDYWTDAIRRLETKPGFSDRLLLDVLRLRRATGTFSGTPAYATMAQLAMRAALPAEAKKVSDEGFASGVLGTGADAEQQKKLRDAAAKAVADDEKQLAQSVKTGASAKDGTALVNAGFAYVMMGQHDTGIPLMEQGIKKGGLQQPDDAKLHLAIAYLAAGQKSKAIEAFKDVGGADGTEDLARLWVIHAQRPA